MCSTIRLKQKGGTLEKFIKPFRQADVTFITMLQFYWRDNVGGRVFSILNFTKTYEF